MFKILTYIDHDGSNFFLRDLLMLDNNSPVQCIDIEENNALDKHQEIIEEVVLAQ